MNKQAQTRRRSGRRQIQSKELRHCVSSIKKAVCQMEQGFREAIRQVSEAKKEGRNQLAEERAHAFCSPIVISFFSLVLHANYFDFFHVNQKTTPPVLEVSKRFPGQQEKTFVFPLSSNIAHIIQHKLLETIRAQFMLTELLIDTLREWEVDQQALEAFENEGGAVVPCDQ